MFGVEDRKRSSAEYKNKMNYKITSTVIGTLLLAAASVLNAQDKQTLDLLVSKGIITKEEAASVAKKSVVIAPKEKTTKSIKLIGRLQVQYENINTDETVNGVESSLAAKNDFIMRRMFLGAAADLGSGWEAELIADFGRADAGYIDKAFISKKVDWDSLQGKLILGYQKINFGLEENTSSSKLLTIERSLATRYFTEGANGRRLGLGGRHTGVFWAGKIPQLKGLEYGVSVTNSYNNSPTQLAGGADNNLLYGASVSYKTNIEDVSLKVGTNFAYTNGMNVNNNAAHREVLGVNPYLTASYLGLTTYADFMLAQIQDGRNSYSEDATPMGVNVAAEYKFDIGDFGKLAPVVRYSWLDTDGRGVKMSDGIRNANANTTFASGQSVYAGVNWYINGDALKFQLGYEWAQLDGTQSGRTAVAQHSEANAVRAQMQVLF